MRKYFSFLIAVTILVTVSCKQKTLHHAPVLTSDLQVHINYFNAARFDSIAIDSFFKDYPKLAKYEDDVKAIYHGNKFRHVWFDEKGVIEFANSLYSKVKGIANEGVYNVFIQAHFNVLTTEFPVSFLNPNVELRTMGGRSIRFGYAAMIGMKSVIGPIMFAITKDHFRNDWKASLIIGFHY